MIDFEGMRREVNKMDKEFHIKLKKPKKTDTKKRVLEISNKIDQNLLSLIAIINHIDLKNYIEDDDKFVLNIENPFFKYESQLKWRSSEKYDVDNYIFKLRFLTNLDFYMINRCVDISQETKSKYMKDEATLINIVELSDYIYNLNKNIINKKQYRNYLLKIQEYLVNDVKWCKLNIAPEINLSISNLQTLFEPRLFSRELTGDEDEIIYWILTIAYELVTLNNNIDEALPGFKYVEGATNKYDLSKLIIALGDSILVSTDDMRNANPIFNAFINTSPKVNTTLDYKDRRRMKLHIGCLALTFAKFVLNSDDSSIFIDKMMVRGKK